MKYFLLILFSSLACSLAAQTNQLDEIHKLMESFKEEQDNTLITKAHALVEELFEDKKHEELPLSLNTKAKVLTGLLEHTEMDDPMSTCDEIVSIYENALAKDPSMRHRNQLLTDLYTAKIAMMNKGNKAYEQKSYDEAHRYYDKSLDMNKIEVSNPRYAPIDTSLMYTSAVFANLAGHKEKAAETFKQLIEWEYNRRDLYDNLIIYYQEKEMIKEATDIGVLRDQRFPPQK